MINPLTPRDYASTPKELAKTGRALIMIREIACKEKNEQRRNALFECGWSFWNFCQIWDDLIDGEKFDAQEKLLAIKGMQKFVLALLENPIYRENANGFKALFVTAISRDIASVEFANSKDPKERGLAPAIRCGDIDIMVFLAHIAGDFEFAQEMSSKQKLRRYDLADKPDEKGAV